MAAKRPERGSRAARTASKPPADELVITRLFDAPRDLVWKAWTDPEHLKHWWGPKAFTAPVVKIDFRVGGKYLYCMRSPDGKDYWGTGIYREIVVPERIVATDSFADAQGNVVPAAHYGMSGMPLEMLITVTFEEAGGKTKLTLRHAGIPGGPDRDGASQGWSESFDKLAGHLATLEKAAGTAAKDSSGFTLTLRGDREIVMTRTFDAPRRLVFEAHSTCEHLARWLGPRSMQMTSCEMDFRPGGAYRYVHRAPDKTEYAFRGEFREIVPPERIVQTFEFEAMPGHISVDTLVLKEAGSKTHVTVTSRFSTTEDRDGMYSSGMEAGLRDSWDRLDEYLGAMARTR